MSTYAVLSNNVVVNMIICGSNDILPGYSLVSTSNAQIGYTYSNNIFVAPVVTVTYSNLQQTMLSNLANQLLVHQNSGVLVGSNLFPTDDASQIKYLGMMMYAQQSLLFSTVFKTLNNNYVTLTSPQIITVCNAVSGYVQSVFTQDSVLMNAINTASNVAQLNAINIMAGWP